VTVLSTSVALGAITGYVTLAVAPAIWDETFINIRLIYK